MKVYHRDGIEEWMLLHVEIQGETYDRESFAERMFTYFYRIRDRYPGRPVSALAIFTGPDGQKMPGRYRYEYRDTRLTYEYPALSVMGYSDEELEKSSNPFAQVVLAAKMRLLEGKISDWALLKIKILAARRLRERRGPDEIISAITIFLRNYVLLEDPALNVIFDDDLREYDKTGAMNMMDYLKLTIREEVEEELLEKGLKEGREEGKELAAASFVENLLKDSDFGLEKIASLANVSVEFAGEVKRKLNGSLLI